MIADVDEELDTTTYKTTNWSDYNTALKQRGSLSIWFDAAMVWEAQPSGKRGRQQAYSDAAIKAEGEWKARKHGGPKRRLWRKIHIGIDEETLEIRAVEVTTSSIGDAPMLPDLLNQIPADEDLGSVTADGAFDTRKCHDAIAARNAHAVIPLRKTAKLWKADTPGARARNEAVRSSKYLGRALWRHLTGYHRRSRVETKMHCLKLLCQRLSARDFDRKVADPNTGCHPKWLHCTGHSKTRGHSINPSGVRGGLSINRFVQQSRAEGVHISAADEFLPALQAANASGKPTVLDVPMINNPTPTTGHWNILDIYSPDKDVSHVAT